MRDLRGEITLDGREARRLFWRFQDGEMGWDGNKDIVLRGQRCEEDVVGEEARRESCEAVILEVYVGGERMSDGSCEMVSEPREN